MRRLPGSEEEEINSLLLTYSTPSPPWLGSDLCMALARVQTTIPQIPSSPLCTKMKAMFTGKTKTESCVMRSGLR
jgi:hypothetical protein